MKKRTKGILILIPMLFVVIAMKSPKMKAAAVITPAAPTPAQVQMQEALPEETPAPTPEPTPEPTPAPTPPLPVGEDGSFTIYGKTFHITDEFVDLGHMTLDDNGAAIASMIPFMPNLKAVDMDSCGIANERMAEIRDANPNVEVIWRVNFGENYSVRTNVTKILASMPSKGGQLGNEVGDQLKYCTKVRYLDLGHNEDLSDISFLQYMPELEVVVISITAVSDLTPFTNCPNLLYLEAGNTKITDLSPLAQCSKLSHLNIGTCDFVSDISPIYDLPLYRLWLGSVDPVPADQVAEMQKRHPQCIIDTTCPSGRERNELGAAANEGFVMNNWKYYQNYLDADWSYRDQTGYFPAQRPLGYFKVIYKCFEYNTNPACYAFSWNDPNYESTSHVDPVNTFVVNTSLLSEYWEEEASIVPDVLEDPPGEILYVDPY